MLDAKKILKTTIAPLMAVLLLGVSAVAQNNVVQSLEKRVEQGENMLLDAQAAMDGQHDLLNKETMMFYATAMSNAFDLADEVVNASISEDKKFEYLFGETDKGGNVIDGKGGLLVKMGVAFSYAFLHHGREEMNDNQKINWVYKLKAGTREILMDLKSAVTFPQPQSAQKWYQKRSWEPIQEIRRERVADEMIGKFRTFIDEKVSKMDMSNDDTVGSQVKSILNQMIEKNINTKRYRVSVQKWARNAYFGIGLFLTVHGPDLFAFHKTYFSILVSAAIYGVATIVTTTVKQLTNSGDRVRELEELQVLLNSPKKAVHDVDVAVGEIRGEFRGRDKDRAGPGCRSKMGSI